MVRTGNLLLIIFIANVKQLSPLIVDYLDYKHHMWISC